MKSSYRFLGILCAVVVLGLFASKQDTFAATCTWNGSVDDNWSTAANWDAGCTGAAGVPGNGDDLVFPAPVASGSFNLVNDLGSLTNVSSMSFYGGTNTGDHASYFLSNTNGFPLEISSSAGISSQGYNIYVNFDNNFDFSVNTVDIDLAVHGVGTSYNNIGIAGIISGTNGLNIIGSNYSDVTLSGNNIFGGNVIINGGYLNYSNTNALGSTAVGTTITNGGQLNLSSSALLNEDIVLDNSRIGVTDVVNNTYTINGDITIIGSGSIVNEISFVPYPNISNVVMNGNIIGGSSDLLRLLRVNLVINTAGTFSGIISSALSNVSTVYSTNTLGDFYVRVIPPSTSDNATFTGNVDFTSTSALFIADRPSDIGPVAPSLGQVYTIATYSGNLTGTFEGIPDGTILVGAAETNFYRISYGTGTNSSITLTVVSAQSTTTTLTSNLNPSSNYGQIVTFTAIVTPTTSGTPTGTVSFYNIGNTLLGTGTVNGSGIATYSTNNFLPSNEYFITAVYSGDSNFDTSTSSELYHSIYLADPGVTITSSANPALTTDTLSYTITVTGGGATPTGTVELYDLTDDEVVLIGTGTLDGSGVVVITLSSPLSPGTHTIAASYTGSNYYYEETNMLTQVVNAPLANTGENVNMFGILTLSILSILGAVVVIRKVTF